MSAEGPTAPRASPAATGVAGRTQTAGEHCQMTISSPPGGERITIGMRGEVDHAARQQVHDNLVKALDASQQGLDLDLADVSFWDCSALGALLEARQHAVTQGKSMTLLTASPIVRRVLDLTGTTSLFTAPAGL
jgi:anti-anti-sigma factor